jgi:hypothetical protein
LADKNRTGKNLGKQTEGNADPTKLLRIDENDKQLEIDEHGTRVSGPGAEKENKKPKEVEEKKEERKYKY